MRRTQNPPEDSATEENDTREHAPNTRERTLNTRERTLNAREHALNAREHALNARERTLNTRDATTHSGNEASKAVVMESGVSSAGLRVGVRFRRLTTQAQRLRSAAR